MSDDLARIFAAAPPFSREDMTTMVAEFRKRRASFNLGERAPKKTKEPSAKSKAALTLGDSLKLDI